MKNLLVILISFLFYSNSYAQIHPCTSARAINESASYGFNFNGDNYYEFTWNNYLLHLQCNNFTSRIEVFNDHLTDPNTGIEYPINDPRRFCTANIIDIETFPINFFNENTYTIIIDQNFSNKCFWWRIVIEGSNCPNNTSCSTSTDWHFLQYQ